MIRLRARNNASRATELFPLTQIIRANDLRHSVKASLNPTYSESSRMLCVGQDAEPGIRSAKPVGYLVFTAGPAVESTGQLIVGADKRPAVDQDVQK